MNNKYTIIALFGPSGSGKDTVLKQTSIRYNKELHKIVGCTTRPKRDYEREGIDYYFLSEIDFLNNSDVVGYTCFNHWHYGILRQSLRKDKINIGVFSIIAIRELLKCDDIEVYPFYLMVDDKIRLQRNLEREISPNCIEICRRFLSDVEDFNIDNIDFGFYSDRNNDCKDLEHIKKDIGTIIKIIKENQK